MLDYFNLNEQQKRISDHIDKNIARVLSHGKYILGPEVDELEDQLTQYTGAKHCITCANGTDALQISLMAVGVGAGDEVIVPAFSYIATAEAAALLGARPVYVDVCPESFNLDTTLIEEKITKKTKAIIPVSLYGQPANLNPINQIADKFGLAVIEDAAQSFGATYFGKKSCNLSDIACTSFFPTKPLGCYGDGGAIFTSNEELARKIRQIARHGQERRYYHTVVGINSRLDSIQAAVLLAKLPILDDEIAQRNKNSKIYETMLGLSESIAVPVISTNSYSSWAQYTLKVPNRDDLVKKLKAAGIPSAVHYPLPLYKQPAVAQDTILSNTELLSKNVLSIPNNSYLTQKDLLYVSETILQSLK